VITMDTIGKVRRAYWVQGRTIKAICREQKLARETVRRIVRSGKTSTLPVYERKEQPFPKLGLFLEQLDALLLENAGKPKRDRLTMKRIYERLREAGYVGCYDAVRRYARSWRQRHAASIAVAYVPLSFAPGEAYQFDWSHEIVILDGVTMHVKAAHMRLCHSRMPFVRAYLREAQEMVFDAHDKGFAFFKGACTRGIYDNMKTAVDAIHVGKDRAFNRRFLAMCSHYLVEPTACTPGAGWEKGQVENQVGNLREELFVPRPRFKTMEDLNAWLIDMCVAYAKKQAHPEFKDRMIFEVFETERASLIDYRGPFDSYRWTSASVSKTCLVRVDNNLYSVQASAVGRPVDVYIYADRIVLRQDGHVVGDHDRSFARHKRIYDPWHYVPVLARKPGALRNGAPFQGWELPGALGRAHRKLKGMKDGDRQMVDLLAAVLSDGLVAVEAACAQAQEGGTHSADVILNILARRNELPPAVSIATPDRLRLALRPLADCGRYDGLRPPSLLPAADPQTVSMGAAHGAL
jgi:transposase